MIRVENRLGRIEITNDYFAGLVSKTVTGCFGVVDMVASSASQGIMEMAGADVPDKGVVVSVKDGQLVIDLHILVAYGLNISTISNSIVSEVRYAVEQATGLKVGHINVYVDGVRGE